MAIEFSSVPPLIRAMMRSDFYSHHPASVELRQTISYVLLAGDYVYKIKKPSAVSLFSTTRRWRNVASLP